MSGTRYKVVDCLEAANEAVGNANANLIKNNKNLITCITLEVKKHYPESEFQLQKTNTASSEDSSVLTALLDNDDDSSAAAGEDLLNLLFTNIAINSNELNSDSKKATALASSLTANLLSLIARNVVTTGAGVAITVSTPEQNQAVQAMFTNAIKSYRQHMSTKANTKKNQTKVSQLFSDDQEDDLNNSNSENDSSGNDSDDEPGEAKQQPATTTIATDHDDSDDDTKPLILQSVPNANIDEKKPSSNAANDSDNDDDNDDPESTSRSFVGHKRSVSGTILAKNGSDQKNPISSNTQTRSAIDTKINRPTKVQPTKLDLKDIKPDAIPAPHTLGAMLIEQLTAPVEKAESKDAKKNPALSTTEAKRKAAYQVIEDIVFMLSPTEQMAFIKTAMAEFSIGTKDEYKQLNETYLEYQTWAAKSAKEQAARDQQIDVIKKELATTTASARATLVNHQKRYNTNEKLANNSSIIRQKRAALRDIAIAERNAARDISKLFNEEPLQKEIYKKTFNDYYTKTIRPALTNPNHRAEKQNWATLARQICNIPEKQSDRPHINDVHKNENIFDRPLIKADSTTIHHNKTTLRDVFGANNDNFRFISGKAGGANYSGVGGGIRVAVYQDKNGILHTQKDILKQPTDLFSSKSKQTDDTPDQAEIQFAEIMEEFFVSYVLQPINRANVVLIELKKDEKISDELLIKISKRNNGAPVLVKQENHFFFYGCKDDDYNRTDLSKEEAGHFIALPFEAGKNKLINASDPNFTPAMLDILQTHDDTLNKIDPDTISTVTLSVMPNALDPSDPQPEEIGVSSLFFDGWEDVHTAAHLAKFAADQEAADAKLGIKKPDTVSKPSSESVIPKRGSGPANGPIINVEMLGGTPDFQPGVEILVNKQNIPGLGRIVKPVWLGNYSVHTENGGVSIIERDGKEQKTFTFIDLGAGGGVTQKVEKGGGFSRAVHLHSSTLRKNYSAYVLAYPDNIRIAKAFVEDFDQDINEYPQDLLFSRIERATYLLASRFKLPQFIEWAEKNGLTLTDPAKKDFKLAIKEMISFKKERLLARQNSIREIAYTYKISNYVRLDGTDYTQDDIIKLIKDHPTFSVRSKIRFRGKNIPDDAEKKIKTLVKQALHDDPDMQSGINAILFNDIKLSTKPEKGELPQKIRLLNTVRCLTSRLQMFEHLAKRVEAANIPQTEKFNLARQEMQELISSLTNATKQRSEGGYNLNDKAERNILRQLCDGAYRNAVSIFNEITFSIDPDKQSESQIQLLHKMHVYEEPTTGKEQTQYLADVIKKNDALIKDKNVLDTLTKPTIGSILRNEILGRKTSAEDKRTELEIRQDTYDTLITISKKLFDKDQYDFISRIITTFKLNLSIHDDDNKKISLDTLYERLEKNLKEKFNDKSRDPSLKNATLWNPLINSLFSLNQKQNTLPKVKESPGVLNNELAVLDLDANQTSAENIFKKLSSDMKDYFYFAPKEGGQDPSEYDGWYITLFRDNTGKICSSERIFHKTEEDALHNLTEVMTGSARTLLAPGITANTKLVRTHTGKLGIASLALPNFIELFKLAGHKERKAASSKEINQLVDALTNGKPYRLKADSPLRNKMVTVDKEWLKQHPDLKGPRQKLGDVLDRGYKVPGFYEGMVASWGARYKDHHSGNVGIFIDNNGQIQFGIIDHAKGYEKLSPTIDPHHYADDITRLTRGLFYYLSFKTWKSKKSLPTNHLRGDYNENIRVDKKMADAIRASANHATISDIEADVDNQIAMLNNPTLPIPIELINDFAEWLGIPPPQGKPDFSPKKDIKPFLIDMMHEGLQSLRAFANDIELSKCFTISNQRSFFYYNAKLSEKGQKKLEDLIRKNPFYFLKNYDVAHGRADLITGSKIFHFRGRAGDKSVDQTYLMSEIKRVQDAVLSEPLMQEGIRGLLLENWENLSILEIAKKYQTYLEELNGILKNSADQDARLQLDNSLKSINHALEPISSRSIAEANLAIHCDNAYKTIISLYKNKLSQEERVTLLTNIKGINANPNQKTTNATSSTKHPIKITPHREEDSLLIQRLQATLKTSELAINKKQETLVKIIEKQLTELEELARLKVKSSSASSSSSRSSTPPTDQKDHKYSPQPSMASIRAEKLITNIKNNLALAKEQHTSKDISTKKHPDFYVPTEGSKHRPAVRLEPIATPCTSPEDAYTQLVKKAPSLAEKTSADVASGVSSIPSQKKVDPDSSPTPIRLVTTEQAMFYPNPIDDNNYKDAASPTSGWQITLKESPRGTIYNTKNLGSHHGEPEKLRIAVILTESLLTNFTNGEITLPEAVRLKITTLKRKQNESGDESDDDYKKRQAEAIKNYYITFFQENYVDDLQDNMSNPQDVSLKSLKACLEKATQSGGTFIKKTFTTTTLSGIATKLYEDYTAKTQVSISPKNKTDKNIIKLPNADFLTWAYTQLQSILAQPIDRELALRGRKHHPEFIKALLLVSEAMENKVKIYDFTDFEAQPGVPYETDPKQVAALKEILSNEKHRLFKEMTKHVRLFDIEMKQQEKIAIAQTSVAKTVYTESSRSRKTSVDHSSPPRSRSASVSQASSEPSSPKSTGSVASHPVTNEKSSLFNHGQHSSAEEKYPLPSRRPSLSKSDDKS